MALKHRITKAQFEKLPDEIKEHYEATADGKNYELDVSGLPEPEDNGALVRARDREKERADNAEEELSEVRSELEKVRSNLSTGEKDVARVTERYQKREERIKSEADARIKAMRDRVAERMITSEATALASKISTAPQLMIDYAKKRMTVEFDDDDNPVLKFTDKDGNVSDKIKIDDVEKELVADPNLSAIVKGSKARGSGAPLTVQPLNPSGAGLRNEPVDLLRADRATLVERVRAKVAEKQGAQP